MSQDARYDWRTNRDKMGLLKNLFWGFYNSYIRYGKKSEEYHFRCGEISGVLLLFHLDGLIEDDFFIPEEIFKMRTFELAWRKLLKDINPNHDFLKEE